MIVTNTGAPQGCVLSPILFTLYTSNCRSNYSDCQIVKYADDTVILGYMSKKQESNYLNVVKYFTDWCSDNCLTLNVKKTKEMIFDFRRKQGEHVNIVINNEQVEKVDSYKYLGTIIDSKLDFTENTLRICNKANKRLFFLRKLKEFHVDPTIIRMFYESVIRSVVNFCLVCWFGNLSGVNKILLTRIDKAACKIIGDKEYCCLEDIYRSNVTKTADKIKSQDGNFLKENFIYLRSGIRLCSVNSRTNRYRNSFIPTAIRFLNDECKR
jgi:hypothetical protein